MKLLQRAGYFTPESIEASRAAGEKLLTGRQADLYRDDRSELVVGRIIFTNGHKRSYTRSGDDYASAFEWATGYPYDANEAAQYEGWLASVLHSAA